MKEIEITGGTSMFEAFRALKEYKLKHGGEDCFCIFNDRILTSDDTLNKAYDRIRQCKTDTIDWEQRRYEVAKELMNGFAANSHNSIANESMSMLAQWSVSGANKLIRELKNTR